MIMGIFVIIFTFLTDDILSSALSGSNVSPECSNKQKVQENTIPKAGTENFMANITATFHVSLIENNTITGNVEWILNNDEEVTTLIVKLLSFVDGEVHSIDYLLLFANKRGKAFNDGTHIFLNCIHIPPSVNTSIKAEVYRTNTTSCDCDVIKMVVSNCLPLCQMNLISSHTFHVSKDACYLYTESDQEGPRMNFLVDMVAKEIIRFKGYISNVNPFSSARVSIFPDDEQHHPHVPLLEFPVKIDTYRAIHFSVNTASMGYFDFYVKLQVTCWDEPFSIDYISDSIKVQPYVPDSSDKSGDSIYDDTFIANGGKFDKGVNKRDNTGIFYAVMTGILVLSCIITVTVWFKVIHRNKRRCLFPRTQEVDKDLQMKLCSANMPSTEEQGPKSAMNNCSSKTTTTKNVMMLSHPDTDKHKQDVDDLVMYLQMHDIHVQNRPEVHFQNWRDFAEKAGVEYKDIIIVMSRGLFELCEIYKCKQISTCNDKIESVSETNADLNRKLQLKQAFDERWNELLKQRNGEYIPCVALDNIRTVIQDRRSEVGIHFVTFRDKFENNNMGNCEGIKATCLDSILKCSSFKQTQKRRHFQQRQHFEHHMNNGIQNTELSNIQTTNELEYFFRSRDQCDILDFIKQNTFLQTKETYFHTISRNELKCLLLSGKDKSAGLNTLSLIPLLKLTR